MYTARFQTTAWLRFVKKMEKIEFYTTIDETDEAWTLRATDTVFFCNQYREGLAPTPQSTDHLAKATFDGYEVQIYEVPTAVPVVSSAPTISSVSTAYGLVAETTTQRMGSHAERDSLKSSRGSGPDIWGASDYFYFCESQLTVSCNFSAEMYTVEFQTAVWLRLVKVMKKIEFYTTMD
jgi:hypothetical protein